MKQEEKPLVTIVTITFNLIKAGREKYFRQCIESVHSQTYENIEHIVIDGASTDGTLDVIKEFEKKGWIKYVSEKDDGIYDAMNKGIEMAKGKYIAFLNSDDYYHNNSAVELSAGAIEASHADYSFADTAGINNKTGQKINVWHGNINRLPFGTHYCHQSMFVRTDVMRELGGFNTSFKVSADSDLMIRLFSLQKKYIYLPKEIVSYRSGGLSNQHILECRNDHSFAFYNHLGKDIGLTREECFSIWNFSMFDEDSELDCLNLAVRISRPEWTREIVLKMADLLNSKEKLIVKLFGFIPIFSIREIPESNIDITYLFNVVPIFYKKKKFKQASLYFFKYVPFLTIKILNKNHFSISKLFGKYLNIFLNSKLRQPIRKILHLIGLKK